MTETGDVKLSAAISFVKMPRQWSITLNEASGREIYANLGLRDVLLYVRDFGIGLFTYTLDDLANNIRTTRKILVQ